eukprot:TRINITY_DN19386_c0_g1_i1.p1 TRINITY_DN19386_c0_g1~~TRINITY_DN19386_c0_g1_i1.p1  ORF type:complete len:122 (+),score=14.27 TRINITY_DN19386_c0_g1_i1:37-402(+)
MAFYAPTISAPVGFPYFAPSVGVPQFAPNFPYYGGFAPSAPAIWAPPIVLSAEQAAAWHNSRVDQIETAQPKTRGIEGRLAGALGSALLGEAARQAGAGRSTARVARISGGQLGRAAFSAF